jgi:hypothetical protein
MFHYYTKLNQISSKNILLSFASPNSAVPPIENLRVKSHHQLTSPLCYHCQTGDEHLHQQVSCSLLGERLKCPLIKCDCCDTHLAFGLSGSTIGIYSTIEILMLLM